MGRRMPTSLRCELRSWLWVRLIEVPRSRVVTTLAGGSNYRQKPTRPAGPAPRTPAPGNAATSPSKSIAGSGPGRPLKVLGGFPQRRVELLVPGPGGSGLGHGLGSSGGRGLGVDLPAGEIGRASC